jgi:glycerol kinase
VPALTGLGAPDWDPAARGIIVGITRGTTRAHVARATLEALACEVRDVIETLPVRPTRLKIDGGASANDLLCQMQADQLDATVLRPQVQETTGLGAAFLAGLGHGIWSSSQELTETWTLDRAFEPAPARRADAVVTYRRWRAAVARSGGWANL